MKRHGIVFLVLAGVLASAMSLAIGSSARASEPVYWHLENVGNHKCLQPVNGSLDPGAAIVQEPCDDVSSAQRWTFISLGGTRYHFKNKSSGLCLDARGGATNGTPIEQWTCNSISNEIWDTGDAPLPPPYPLTSVPFPVTSQVSGTSSHCLDVPSSQNLDGLAMQLWGCNGTLAQGWTV